MVIRMIPFNVRTFDELGLPPVIAKLAERPRGLILVTGPTGSGKSTTLAAMIDKINKERKGHIITVEDPIEFIHRHQSCIVNQREIGTDTKSFASALKYALREDPDVILVGEMRDLETIAAALTIAETGHLVLATLHTNSAAESINRIIDVFPSNQQSQVRAQLAFVLEGVVTQTLLPKARGRGRVMACEIMVATPAIRALIRDDKIHQIYSAMQSGKKHGMQTMNDALYQLYINREVTQEECERVVVGAEGVPPDDRRDPDGGAGDRPGRTARSAPLPPTAAKRRIVAMPMFEYTARNAQTGQIQKGQLDVPSKDDVSAYLRKNRLILVSVREAPKQIKLSMGGRAGEDARHRDLHPAVRDDDQRRPAAGAVAQHPGASRPRTRRSRTSPGRWCTTSRAATPWPTPSRKHPKAFTDLYVNMVAAGEAGGILDTILLRLATFLEKNDALVRKVKGAMIYPGVIIAVAAHRHRGPAHLRHPDVPEHVRLGQPGAAAADPGRDRRCRTS